MWAKYRGAKRIFMVDCIEERLVKARSQGAETIDFSKANVVETMQKLLPGWFSPSLAFFNRHSHACSQGVLMYASMPLAFDTQKVMLAY